jgi:CheY-like chemotaxis protein
MAERAPTSDIVVLVVDDETLVRMVTAETLGDEGFQVYEARDGQEALTILEVRGEGVRALVSDISMPNLNGLDLAAIVNKRWPQIGIVVVSGHPPTDVRLKMPEGARFLAKPYREKDLVKAIEAVVQREVAPGPPVPLYNSPLLRAGEMHGTGGLAQPLAEPDE